MSNSILADLQSFKACRSNENKAIEQGEKSYRIRDEVRDDIKWISQQAGRRHGVRFA